jgi:hypothetical protein
MFVSPTVNLRPDPSTLYAHAQEYVTTLDELGRFRNFFLQRIPELEEVAKAQKVLGASREARRTWEIETPYSEKERRLLREAEGKDRLLLLDEWVRDPRTAISHLQEFHKTWDRLSTHAGWVDPAGWNLLDLLRVGKSLGYVSGYLEAVIAKHNGHTIQGPVAEYAYSMCRVGVSQMMLARIVEVLEIFRKCVLDLYVAFKDAWEILKPSVRYHPVGELVDWDEPCAYCGVPLTAGSSCVPVNGARGSQGIICSSCTPFS